MLSRASEANSGVCMSSADVLGHPWLQQGVNKVWLCQLNTVMRSALVRCAPGSSACPIQVW